MPYVQNEEIILIDGFGNTDTTVINEYTLSPNLYSSKQCFLKSESLKVELNLYYSGGSKCRINFSSALSGVTPYLFISSEDCQFSAYYENLVQGGGIIKEVDSFEWEGQVYEEVLLVKLLKNQSGINEFALAKNIGFVFIKIDDVILTPIN